MSNFTIDWTDVAGHFDPDRADRELAERLRLPAIDWQDPAWQERLARWAAATGPLPRPKHPDPSYRGLRGLLRAYGEQRHSYPFRVFNAAAMPPGVVCKVLREAAGVTFREMCDALDVSAGHLEAAEASEVPLWLHSDLYPRCTDAVWFGPHDGNADRTAGLGIAYGACLHVLLVNDDQVETAADTLDEGEAK